MRSCTPAQPGCGTTVEYHIYGTCFLRTGCCQDEFPRDDRGLALSWQQAALIECWEDESTSGRDSSIATFQAEIMLVCCSLTSFSLLSGSIDCFPSHSPLLLLVG